MCICLSPNWVPAQSGSQNAMDWCPIQSYCMIFIQLSPRKPEVKKRPSLVGEEMQILIKIRQNSLLLVTFLQNKKFLAVLKYC